MKQQPLTIGLFGFGVVGEGLYRVLQQTPALRASVRKICIKHPGRKRNAPADLFTTDKEELLNDPEINVIVEVTNDPEEAFHIVRSALRNGKDAVSAGKKMIAENFSALLALQQETGRSFLYESAACASIPVIRNLEEYYDNDLLHSLRAVVNGSTNFILTKMNEAGLSFREALLLAQQSGFAETDPALDIDGWDAVHKWSFLLTHAYGILKKPSELLFTGIRHLHPDDTRWARAGNYMIKLVAQARKLKNGKIAAFVLPQLVTKDDPLAFVTNEYNGVVIESGFADKQFFYGKGAGSLPTASAVLSDIAALRYGYKYEYRKLQQPSVPETTDDYYLRVYLSFPDPEKIPRDRLEWIEEAHAGTERNYIRGVVACRELLANDWWRQDGVSLLLEPDPIVEEVETRRVKRKSLELAGIL